MVLKWPFICRCVVKTLLNSQLSVGDHIVSLRDQRQITRRVLSPR